jgi:hypothetical protein
MVPLSACPSFSHVANSRPNLPRRHTAPTTTPDCRRPDAAAEALVALQGWVAFVGVVALVVEVEAALEEEACLIHLIHTAPVQPLGPDHPLRPEGAASTGRGHLHTRGADPGHPHQPRGEEAEDDTRRTIAAVAARVAIAMGVASVAAEAAREIEGVTAEPPWMGLVAGHVRII